MHQDAVTCTDNITLALCGHAESYRSNIFSVFSPLSVALYISWWYAAASGL